MLLTKFYHVTQFALWSFDQSFVTPSFLWENFNFIKISPQKPIFLRGVFILNSIIWDWSLGMALRFYTSVAKVLKPKVRKSQTFWALIPTFVKITGEKLVGGVFLPPPYSIRLMIKFQVFYFILFALYL